MYLPQMNEWRSCRRFTDVVIEIDGRKFDCHRVALAGGSKYFSTMLTSSFRESTDYTIHLKEVISADTFADVLQFIYTGDVELKSENVYQLLVAADYLKLNPELEKRCAIFIENSWRFEHMFDAISFAYTSGRASVFYNIANSISCHLENVSGTSEFLELPFEVIKMIIDVSTLKEKIVVDATMRWINHKREERWRYFIQLSRLGMMAGVAFTEIESMARSLVPDGTSGENVASYLKDLERQSYDKSLLVYWKWGNLSKDILEVSIDHHVKCNILQPGYFGGTKKVAFDKSLIYSLDLVFEHPERELEFGRLYFRSHTVDGKTLANLQPPRTSLVHSVLFFDSFQLCCLPKNRVIYLYIAYEKCLYEYLCDADMWFPLLTITEGKWTAISAIAACETNTILYFVHGRINAVPSIDFYDINAQLWKELPKPNYPYSARPIMCTFKGKLYLYNHIHSLYEIYDPSTEKWGASKPKPYRNVAPAEHVVVYNDELWLFYKAVPKQDSEPETACIVYIYRPESDSWRQYPLMRAAIEKHGRITNDNLRFLDAIVPLEPDPLIVADSISRNFNLIMDSSFNVN